VLLLVKTPLHPPVALAVANQLANAVLTAACVWQDGVVELAGQLSITCGTAATVKVAWQVVVSGAQLLAYVNVTVVEPPAAAGAPVLLFVRVPLQPPEALAVASHVAKAAFTAACVCPKVTV
jgi:hypothetical protein